jgi:hypothetical protein
MNHKTLVRILLAVGLAVLAGCSKSPTEPRQTPSNPVPPVPQVTYDVSVTASPGSLMVGGATASTVTVSVRRNDTGSPPPDGSTISLTSTLGEFGSVGSGLRTVTLQLVGGRAQAVLFPGAQAGTAAVQAALLDASGKTVGVGVANVAINQAATFFIGSVSPSVGSPQGGDQVTINGGGFVGPVRVTFNGAAANVLSVTPTRIRVVVPSAAAAGVTVGVGQAVPVTVGVTINVNQAGTLSDNLSNAFTYSFGGTIDQPQVFSVSPSTGADSGGTRVTIIGTGFDSPVQVFFQGGSAGGTVALEASVVSATATQLVVLSPPAQGFGNSLANNAVDIRVKNLNSGFETTKLAAFRYGSKVLVTSFGPGQLEYNDTTTLITIHGQGFASPVAASIAGVAAHVVSVSGTEVVVQSPGVQPTGCADVSLPVSVVNINTGDSSVSSALFVYKVPKTTINSVVPSSGPQGGGTSVSIVGSGFDGPGGINDVRVQFGDQSAQVTGGTPGSVILAVTPAFTGNFPTQSCSAGGVQGTMNIGAAVDVKVTNLATTCTDTAPKGFIYNPSDISCKVPPPTPPAASFTDAISGKTVTFVDTSTGSPTSWSWNFGDGGSSVLENPTHTYLASGNYAVKLTVSNASGSSSTNQLVTIP